MEIRNVILLSHSGAGKTSLSEAILFTTGAITRMGKVEEGNTTSDYDPEEIKRKISLNLTILPCSWKGTKINLLDSPGYTDFLGEVIVGLRVVEGAILIVDAASGVEVGTEQFWGYIRERDLPCLIFINKMERENANFYRTLEDIKSKLSPSCLPLQIPIGAQADFKGIIDLISQKAYFGSQSKEGKIPLDLEGEVSSFREKLVEAAVEAEDELIAKYLEGEEIGTDEIQRGIQKGVKARKLFPVLVGSALQNIGIPLLLDAILAFLPSPQEVPVIVKKPSSGEEVKISPSPKAPLVAFVFKTTADPYMGKLSYFRVFSGVLTSNSQAWNSNKEGMERVGQLFFVRGKTQETTAQVEAGDIGAVARLPLAGTGDTLSTKENPFILPPLVFPSPILSLALHPQSKADLDKMGFVLPRLLEEDPVLKVRREQDTGETLLAGLGETHLEVAVERLKSKFGVEVKLEIPKVPYKETISTSAKADYRHKKQTGGHGQFAHVYLELEPLPRGSGIQFEDRIVGMAISRNYIPAVEKGVYEAAQEGVLAGYPVVDVKAILYDGKEHPVDSSDICFKIAGAYAFKKALEQAKPLLLEPIMKLKVTVPEAFTGDIISDLNTKRARVLGMTPEGGKNTIEALVPLAEIQRYAIDLRSLTQGRGTFTIEFSHYEEVPPHLAQKIIAERKAAKLT